MGYVKKLPCSLVTEEYSRMFQKNILEYSRRTFQDLRAVGLALAVYRAMQFGGYLWAGSTSYRNRSLWGKKGAFIRRI